MQEICPYAVTKFELQRDLCSLLQIDTPSKIYAVLDQLVDLVILLAIFMQFTCLSSSKINRLFPWPILPRTINKLLAQMHNVEN